MILGWTQLRPSARERRLQQSALATALLVTCALTFAALYADPRHPRELWATVVACAAIAAFIAWRLRPRGWSQLEVAVDANGLPWLRATSTVTNSRDAGPPLARCVFAAPWLITLQCGALRTPVWPDSMPAEAFRRLHACVRWRSSVADPAPDPASMSAPSTPSRPS